MSNQSLIVRDDAQLDVLITSEAQALKNSALESAMLIAKVSNAHQQELAVAAQVEIRRVLKLAEDSRVEVKAPVLDFGRKIDSLAKDFSNELKAEEIRISRLVGDFQALELAKVRAAEAARQKELNEIDRRRQEELASAKSHEELDAINERACEEQKAIPVAAPVRVSNQSVREDWEITVTNLYDLARSHPGCVRIEPRLGEIKALLNNGITVAGITAKKIVIAGVRLGRQQTAIEA